MTSLVLLPSPLLGPAVWEPVAGVLRARDRACVVAEPAGTTPAEVLDTLHDSLPLSLLGDDVVLVPHSNAGLYVPGLAARFGFPAVAAVVFVDAALPPLDGASARTAPDDLVARLGELADDDGLLPPWSRWWDESDVEGLFPDDETRRRVQAQERRLPLSYFTDAVPAAEWGDLACAYLAFGATYADELARARGAGWPTDELPGRHLEMLHAPALVADRVLALAQRLQGTG
jgi:hypothetical protein